MPNKIKYTGRKGILVIKGKNKGKFTPYRKMKRYKSVSYGRPAVFPMKQTIVETVNLNAPDASWTSLGGGIFKEYTYSLGALGTDISTRIVGMFAQYKLAAVSQQIYFSDGGSIVTGNRGAGTITVPSSNFHLHYAQNPLGRPITDVDEDYMCTRQNSRRVLCMANNRKAIKIYSKLTQLVNLYGGAVNTDYGRVRAKYVSTDETTTNHYGNILQIQPINAAGMPPITMKIYTTVYIMCKQIKGL